MLALLAACSAGGDEGAAEPTTPLTQDPTAQDSQEMAEAEPTDVPTQAVTAEEPPEATEAVATSDEPLKLGYILPETGGIAFLGPGMIGAVELAVQEINEAGGVLEQDVELVGADEGDASTGTAQQSAERLILSEQIDAIIGAAASGVSLTIIDRVTSSGIVQCGPSNTSPNFTTYDDDGYYFRAAPSDILQGPVLAETMIGGGNSRIAFLSRADDYGRALVQAASDAVSEVGAEVATEVFFDPAATSFDAEVAQIAAAEVDAVLLIAFAETAQILQAMIEAGVGPQDIDIYVGSGSRSDDLPLNVDPNDPSVIAGLQGVSPAATSDDDFLTRLREQVPDLEATLFTGQSYDCTAIIALAAEQAGSTDPAAIKDEMVAVTRDGTACTSFQECKDLIGQGEDIDYDGVSGPLEFIEEGEPSVAAYDKWQFTEEGEIETVDTLEAEL